MVASLESAFSQVSADELRRIVSEMTAIPSPAGGELELAEYLVRTLGAGGLEATTQRLDGRQANAVARVPGSGDGPTLMLYAPIDMHIAGDPNVDGPWIDFDGRRDLVPKPSVEGDFVVGLGAENPKGHAACVVMAALALARAKVPLQGSLLAGFGGGGMPVNRSPDPTIARADVAHGRGCAYLLEHGFRPDFAVIAKPGAAVAYEEVGLCWFEIVVGGEFGYAGVAPRAGSRNALLDAATVVAKLNAWFPEYTARNTSGLVAPRGSVSAIAGGWPEKPAFTSAKCKIYVDLRISPRTTPADAQAQFEAALDAIRASEPGIEIASEMVVAIPGTSTPPEHWIVTSSIKAWEMIAQKPHAFRTGTSGATDANILRGHGVPTARVGMGPNAADAPFAGRFSMGVVNVEAMVRLTRLLIAIVLETCTRSRREVGLT
jgi:acetylornithine deacetylase/succinyl-diaminopimelate desuccinylase-like protein